MKVLNFTGCCQEQINNVTEFVNNSNIDCQSAGDDTQNLIISDEDAKLIEDNDDFDGYDFHLTDLSYDVHFDDENSSNCKGWAIGFAECKDYIDAYNGSNESYFSDYKGGTVSIYCHETDETVYSEQVK